MRELMRSHSFGEPPDLPGDRSGDEAGESTAFVLELPSDVGVIEGAVAYLVNRCREVAFDGSRLNLNFRVGMCEALANAVIYGNGRDPEKLVRVEVQLSPQRVAVRVADQGNGFNPRAVPDPTLPGNVDRPGGRGIFLLFKLMDEVEYNERGNEVRFVLHRLAPMRKASGE